MVLSLASIITCSNASLCVASLCVVIKHGLSTCDGGEACVSDELVRDE